MFVSSLDAKVWDPSSRYCIKVDISGLKKYPDFGHLLDFGAYYDDDCFWWKNEEELKHMLHSDDQMKKNLARYVLYNCHDLTLPAKQFTGDVSFNCIGTCCIDGNLIDLRRIVESASKDSIRKYSYKTINEQMIEWTKSLFKLNEDDNADDDNVQKYFPYFYVTKLNTSLNPPCRKVGMSHGENIFKKMSRYSTPTPQNWCLYAVVFMDPNSDFSNDVEKDFIDNVGGNTQLSSKELIKVKSDDNVNKGITEFIRTNGNVQYVALGKTKLYKPDEFINFVNKKKATVEQPTGNILEILKY